MKRAGLTWTGAAFTAAILLGAPAFAEDSRTGTAGRAPGQGAPATGTQYRDTTTPTNRPAAPDDMGRGTGAAGDAPDDMGSGSGGAEPGSGDTGAGSGGSGAGGEAGS